VHLAGFAPAFTWSLCDSETARKSPVPIASVVSVHAKKTADRQIDNETNDRNKMKDYKREISLHAFS
jgi:hypothetical protein